MEAEARSFPLLSTDSVLGTLPPSPLFIFITTPGVCIRSPLLVLRNETQGRWVICLRLQTSVTERAWDQDNLVEAPFISFYGALLPGTCLCHHFSLFLLLLLFMCLHVYLYFMFVYVYILSLFTHIFFFAFPWWLSWWNTCLQYRRPWFNPWVRKISWRREWQPTPAFLPGEFHRQRSLAGYCPWNPKESDRTEQLTLSHFTYISVICMHLFI